MSVLIAIAGTVLAMGAVAGAAALWLLASARRRGVMHLGGWRLVRDSDPLGAPEALQSVIDAIPAVVTCKDRDGRYVLMSAYQATLLGTTPAAAVGHTAAELHGGRSGPDSGTLDHGVIASAAPVGPVEEDHADADGVMRSWLVRKVPLLDRAGAVSHVVTVAFDVTDRRNAEDRLLRAVGDAEAASRAKAIFLATMSHELRTPLNAIIGFSDMIHAAIHGPVGSPKYQEYARDVAESGRFLLAIINDILDLSKIEAGQLSINPQPVDLVELLQRCFRLIEGRARQGAVELTVDAHEGLPVVMADPRSLTQIVINLLNNAVKFTPAGGAVRLHAEATPAGAIEIVVTDTGIGMSEDDIAVALRPFEQIDRGHDRQHEGTGLGLPIVKGLVDLHGGALEIKSRAGEGTRVTVRLPRERVVPLDGAPPPGLTQASRPPQADCA
jgi:signal transduction histidine kinase